MTWLYRSPNAFTAVGRRSAMALTVVAAALLLAACGGSTTEDSLGNERVDSDAMERLLQVEDIAEAGGDTDRLHMEVEDVLATVQAVNPEDTRDVTAWYAMKVRRGRSNSTLIFTVQEFQSADDARRRLSKVESGLGYTPMNAPVGDGSAMLTASSGTGITFIKDYRVLSLQSIAGDGVEPILDDEGIEALARIVERRL